jgi:tetratricopeptide (TPR) repeat protein
VSYVVLAVLALTPLPAAQDAEFRKLTELLSPSVVAVRNQEGYGSGVILDEKGLILTNAHVILSPLPFTVEVEGVLGAFQRVTLVGVHPTKDLALLKIDPSERKAKLVPIKIAESHAVSGDRVYAMGYPSTRGGRVKVLTAGKMVAHDRFGDAPGYEEFQGDMHPGNSGGPLCTIQGEAIGLVTLGYNDGSNQNFAVPLYELNTGGFVPLSRRTSNPANAFRLLQLGEKALKISRQRSGVFAELAADLFSQALLEDFSNPEIHYKIGVAYRTLGAYPKAAAYFVRSLRLKPWPESGAQSYHELGLALVQLGKKEEAATVFREGVAKYPTEGGQDWDALAIYYFKSGNYLEAAVASRAAVRAFGDRGSTMNEAYKESRSRLSVEELGKLREREEALQGDFQQMKAAAEKARSAGTPFLTRDCEKLVRDYEGATRELAPAVAPRSAASPSAKRAKKADPWESQDPGAWYRFETNSGGQVSLEDVGLKSRDDASIVLTVQHFKEGQPSPVVETTSPPLALKVLGEETIQVQNRSFLCEIRSPMDPDATAEPAERAWVILGGRFGGALLKAESPKGSVVSKTIWFHTLKIKGREFDCMVVEAEAKAGETTSRIKTWNCLGLPRPLKIESDEASITLVDFGDAWSQRPPFPGLGAPPKK